MSIGLWAQVAIFTHVMSYDVDWHRFCIWVELPVQSRLCPIFMNSVRLLDIHE